MAKATFEYRTYDTAHTPVPAHYPAAAEKRQAALDEWTAGLNELAADGWEVLAPVPPSLTGGSESALLLRRRAAAKGAVSGD